jgi:exonuclease SbcC
MRLHTLELQAIGPYATPQRIDFGALTASGLFLLEGPTGAGKTTILDAITFALYGGLSGDSSGGDRPHADRLHSHFAAPGLEPSVTLEVSLRGVRYRVRRTPEYLRPKRRGDGFTSQASQVHLERLEDDGWTSLSSNKAEAGEAITEAIGLSRDQFTQVMLLPQGEFAKFLRSDDDGRRVLLTRLFGTQLYDRITAELERRRIEATRARDGAATLITTAAAAAAEAAGLDEAARDELLARPRAERAAQLAEAAARIAGTIETTRAELAVTGTRLAGAQAAVEQADQHAARLLRLTDALGQLAEHEAGRAEHELRAAQLAAARRADPVRPLLAALADADAAFTQARDEVAHQPGLDLAALVPAPRDGARADAIALDAAALDAAALDAVALDAVALDAAALGAVALDGTALGAVALDGTALDGTALDGTALDGTGLDGTGLDGALVRGIARTAIISAGGVPAGGASDDGAPEAAMVAEAVREAAAQEADPLAGLTATAAAGRAAAARAEEAERTAAALKYLVSQEAGRAEREAELARLSEAAAAVGDRAARLEAARQELPAQIAELEERLTAARVAAAGLADGQAQLDAVLVRLVAATQAEDLAGRLDELAAVASAAVDAHHQLVDEHQQAMQERLDNMAAELACQLSADCACPVCGSTGHPAPALMRDGAVLEQDVAEAAAARDAAAAARQEAEEARAELAAAIADWSATAGGDTVAELDAEQVRLGERVTAAQEAAQEAADLEPALADRHAERDQLGEELTAAVAETAAARKEARSARDRLDQLQAEFAAEAGEFSSVSARQAALRQAAAADRGLAQALGALAAARDAADAARRRTGRELTARGFATIEAAQAAVLPPGDVSALDAQVTAWTSELAGREAAVAAGDLAGLDAAGLPAAKDAARAAAGELADALAADRAVRGTSLALEAQAGRLGQRMAELARAQDAAGRLADETEPVIRLAGLARGMEGQRRIALTTYVLRLWFEQVVQAANLRLAAMSAGRYELRRTDEGESRRQRTGLTLSVIDRHTGAERSPKSLSGGETFYTSLALALGLADVVKAEAGGVELDTLFIDEGFGSLDPQTLDQVMAVIDDLRDRGRAVGIVSHVTDLKDRVYERLEVRRLPDGSSAATVVA